MPLTLEFGRCHWSASWLMTLLTLGGVAAFVLLGRWQWHRADEARALQTQFLAGTDAVVDLDRQPMRALPRYTQVSAQGRYDRAHQFLLENMSYDGSPGYQVLTPLALADGRTVIVNRGWVPLSETRGALPDIELAGNPDADPRGRLDNLPVPGISLGHIPPSPGSAWPKVTSFPTMKDLAAALGRPLEPRQLLLDPRQPQGYVRDWKPPGMTPAQHLSYAIQWWGFAATAVLLYALLNRRKRTTGPAPVSP